MLRSELERTLHALFDQEDPIDAIDHGLERVDDETLSRLVAETWGHRDLADLARASYAHPNGFLKLVLIDGGVRFKLRLHVFDVGAGQVTDVHDHRWAFGARVLFGGYRFEEHALREGEHWHAYRYFSPEGGAHYVLESLGSAGTEVVRRGRVAAGSVYTLPADALHSIAPERRTATLMLQGPVVRPSTQVLTRSARGLDARLSPRLRRIGPREYRRHTHEVRRALTMAPSARRAG